MMFCKEAYMSEALLLNEFELENICGGGKPSDVGGCVGQYDVKPGQEYYMHYTSGGYDQWIKIKITRVYEADNGWIFWHHCTIRTADYIVCGTGQPCSSPINKKNLIYSIKR